MLDGVASVLNHFRAPFEVLLQDVRIGGLDSLVVILFKIHDLEPELLVELDGAFVVHLHMSKKKVIRSDDRRFISAQLTRICCRSSRPSRRTLICD